MQITKNPKNKAPTNNSTIIPWGPVVLQYLEIEHPQNNLAIATIFRDIEIGLTEIAEWQRPCAKK